MLATADPFDGVMDFDGPSGRFYADLAANEMVTFDLAEDPNDLLLYIGTGSIEFLAESAGRSHGSGLGNLLLSFEQRASASIEVTYTFVVPEPGTIGLLGMGTLFVLRRPRASGAHSRR
jgi:hypothetical protein